MRYVIKNCPSCTKRDECIAMYLRTSIDCKERTDCLLKQIVELCRKAPILDADWILNKIDIQEVE